MDGTFEQEPSFVELRNIINKDINKERLEHRGVGLVKIVLKAEAARVL